MQNCEKPEIFVLVVREVLVAQDIAMMMRNLRPDAHIVIARSLVEAAETLPEGRVIAAFVQETVSAYTMSALAIRVATDRGRAVLVDEENASTAQPGDYAILAFPFMEEHVLALLSVCHQQQWD